MSTISDAMKQAQLLRPKIFVVLLIVALSALALMAFTVFEAHGVVVHHDIATAIGIVPRPLCGGGVPTPC
jgi:hypothetical protein